MPPDENPAPSTPDTPAAPTPPTTGDPDPDAGAKKAIETERAARKDAEKQAKAFQAELDKLRKQTMNEGEKALTEAREQGKAEARTALGSKLVDAYFTAAAAGRVLTPEALLAFDRATFLTDDGDVKHDDLKAWVETNSAPAGNPRPTGDVDLGARDTPPPPANSHQADLLQMEKDMKAAARR